MPTIAEELGQYVHDLSFDKLPGAVVEKAKWCLLDWIGCAVAGVGERASAILADYALDQKSCGGSTIVGHKSDVSPLWAAFANAALSHAAEMDDGHKTSIMHGSVVTIPAAGSFGQDRHIPGKILIEAIVAGYEVALRTGEALGKSHYAKWHTTGTAGTFGAAAASAKVLGLLPDEVADALGTAGTQAAGLWQFLDDKAMTKVLHPAKASFNGALAAELARKGLTGPHRIFEGPKGFCAATSETPNLSVLTSGLGKHYKIMESNFKVHASCGHTHSPVDAMLAIVGATKVLPDKVRSVRLSTYTEAMAIIANPKPKTPFEAMFSAPFCLATALVRGKVDADSLDVEGLTDPVVRQLAEKVELSVSPEYDSLFPSCRPAKVEITLDDGTCLVQENFYRKGDPENPLNGQEIEAKFRNLAGGRLGDEAAASIISAVNNLEDTEDVAPLFRMLEVLGSRTD